MEFVQNAVLYSIFKLISWLVHILPGKVPCYLGRGLGKIIYRVIKSRRQITEQNLYRAYKDEKSEREIKHLTREVYKNMGLMLIEFILLEKINRDNFRNYFWIDGLEYLEEAFSRDRGVILYGAHLGNWEWMGAFISLLGYPVGALAAEQHNSFFDKKVNQIRRGSGVEIIPLGVSVRRGYRWLKAGKCLLILGDQDARHHGWKIDFFSRPASTYPGAVQLARRTGAAVVPAFMVREGWLRHRLIIKQPHIIKEEASRTVLKKKLQELTGITENVIREYPGQWFWLHKRWKTTFNNDHNPCS